VPSGCTSGQHKTRIRKDTCSCLKLGSGGWIRTIDLRVMSPTSCHCSTPRRRRTDLLSQRSYRQYLRRCDVSRPGSGWVGVVPPRSPHACGSGAKRCLIALPPRSPHPPAAVHRRVFPQGSPRPCAPLASTRRRASSWGRLPSYLLGDLPVHNSEWRYLGAHFPLRCFQRFLLPDIATEPAGRPTTPPPAVRPLRSSRTKRSSPHATKRP
jgi:hypothetical protein